MALFDGIRLIKDVFSAGKEQGERKSECERYLLQIMPEIQRLGKAGLLDPHVEPLYVRTMQLHQQRCELQRQHQASRGKFKQSAEIGNQLQQCELEFRRAAAELLKEVRKDPDVSPEVAEDMGVVIEHYQWMDDTLRGIADKYEHMS